MTELPERLVRYVPKGHRLWFSPKRDPDAAKPEAKRNLNAMGGTNRRDWILCVCGGGLRLAAGPEGETMEPTPDDWLDAVNQCRLSVHSEKMPCPPVTMAGEEQAVREAPPPPNPVIVEQAAEKRGPGRPRKEFAHA